MKDTGNKAVLVTGARGLIGNALIQYSRGKGMHVIGTTRSDWAKPDAASSWYPAVDLLEAGSMDSIVDFLRESRFREVHVVHCVGYFPPFARLDQCTSVDLRDAVELNLLTAMELGRQIIPFLASPAIERSCFVLLSSRAVGDAYPLMAPFLSAKAGLEALVRCLASEFSASGVIPLCMALSTIDSAEERSRVPHGDFANWLSPTEVAEEIGFYLESASELVAGNTIRLVKNSSRFFRDGFLRRIGDF